MVEKDFVESKAGLDDLPIDVVWMLVQYCSYRDIYYVCHKNKYWTTIWNNQSLWYMLFRRDFFKQESDFTSKSRNLLKSQKSTEVHPHPTKSDPAIHLIMHHEKLFKWIHYNPPELIYSSNPPQTTSWQWDKPPSDCMTFRDLYHLRLMRDPMSHTLHIDYSPTGLLNSLDRAWGRSSKRTRKCKPVGCSCRPGLKRNKRPCMGPQQRGSYKEKKSSVNVINCRGLGIPFIGIDVVRSLHRFLAGRQHFLHWKENNLDVIQSGTNQAETNLVAYIKTFLNHHWNVFVVLNHHRHKGPNMIQGSVASTLLSFTVHMYDTRFIGVQLELQFRYSSAIATYSTAVVSIVNMQRCNLNGEAETFLSQHSIRNTFVVYDASIGSRVVQRRKATLSAKHAKIVSDSIPTLPNRIRSNLPGVCQLIMQRARREWRDAKEI